MSNPGKSVSDRRQRRSKVSPRRHQEVGATAAGNSYDSGEFPVLLRMPDVSLADSPSGSATPADSSQGSAAEVEQASMSPALTVKGESRPTSHFAAATDASSPAADLSASSQQESASLRERHTPRRSTPSARLAGSQTPAEAAARFWSLIPPQVAAGGMLLAVIGLCFILLGGPGTKPPSTDAPTSNLNPQPGSPTGQVAGIPASDSPTFDPSGAELSTPKSAAMGPPVPAPAPRIASQPKAPAFDVTPVEEPAAEISAPADSSNAATWPTSDTQMAEPEEDPSPVTGWPEAEVLPVPEGPGINAPVESAQRAELPPLRTSQRSAPTTADPGLSAGSSSGTQLTGTIEIPPPTKLYRQ